MRIFLFFNESQTQILSCSFDFCVFEQLLSFWLYSRLYRHILYFKIKSEFLSYTRDGETRNFT